MGPRSSEISLRSHARRSSASHHQGRRYSSLVIRATRSTSASRQRRSLTSGTARQASGSSELCRAIDPPRRNDGALVGAWDDGQVRGKVAAIGVFAALVVGCGSSNHRTALVLGPAEVVSGSCSAVAGAGSPVKQSCVMVLSDGQRFSCSLAVAESKPSAAALEHMKGCRRLSSLVPSPGMRSVIGAIRRVRTCLAQHGVHGLGGPVLPRNASGSSGPDGELIIGRAGAPTFIAFYTDPAKATRQEPAVERNAKHLGAQVERRAGITILWRRPSASERRHVEACTAS